MITKVVVAPDSFKGSMSANTAARAIARGIEKADPEAVIDVVPIADGGEGTVDALVKATGGRYVEVEVADPLGRPVKARYGLIGEDSMAVIEMAAASGLPLLKPEERNPMKTSTFGTGQLILDAIGHGIRNVVIGIGGSATVDGGTGMAAALGAQFLDSAGNALPCRGETLSDIRSIDVSRMHPRLRRVKFTVACDVKNPLTGPEGAAAVYGPQKGATPEMVKILDAGLANLAACIRRDIGIEVETVPGAGAAGGLGAGLLAFLGAGLVPGVDMVLSAANFEERLRGIDVVFTGEGRVDGQSAYGKATAGVAQAAWEQSIPVILLAGAIGKGAEALREIGVVAMFSIAQGPATESELMANGEALLERAAEEAFRAYKASSIKEEL